MHIPKSAAAVVIVLVTVAGAADADFKWQTVSLDNNPAFTIDVPAISADTYKPDKGAPKGELMVLELASPKSELACHLSRSAYAKSITASSLAKTLMSSERNSMCNVRGKEYVLTIESNLLESNGAWAGECAVGYTDPNAVSYSNPHEKNPGRIFSLTKIAAPGAIYELRCEVGAGSQHAAVSEWVGSWSYTVAHIRDSLRLPAPKNYR